MTEWLKRAWEAVRRMSGDDAYERYLEHWRARHTGGTPPLGRAEFFREEQRRKWEGVKRCC